MEDDNTSAFLSGQATFRHLVPIEHLFREIKRGLESAALRAQTLPGETAGRFATLSSCRASPYLPTERKVTSQIHSQSGTNCISSRYINIHTTTSYLGQRECSEKSNVTCPTNRFLFLSLTCVKMYSGVVND